MEGEKIDQIKRSMLASEQWLSFEDMGAGSRKIATPSKRQVREMVKTSSRRRGEGEFLMRLTRWFQPGKGLELGTHIGLSAAWQLMGNPSMKLISIEGIPEVAEIAQQQIDRLGLQVDIRTGNFDELLTPSFLKEEGPFDYVLIDGNHTYEASLRYFHLLKTQMKDGGLIVLDDIHWSDGMEKAWEEIIQDDEVSLSIDLFRFGCCFIRRSQAKEHFVLWNWSLL